MKSPCNVGKALLTESIAMVERPVQDKAILVLSVKALNWVTLQSRLLERCFN